LVFQNKFICKWKIIEKGIITKFKISLPDFNKEIHEKLLKSGWRELKEPKSLRGQIVLSISFMIINHLVRQLIMRTLIPTSKVAGY